MEVPVPPSIDDSYRPLPSLYLTFSFIWFLSACSWTFNTYKNRHFQTNTLQWTLTYVPLIKALQLVLSFFFWYSCYYHHVCSLWMSFGAYVTGVLFQTASFISFVLISHGYCITCERLSISERRTTVALGSVFYLTLVGYKSSVPYFSVFLLINYFVTFYVIFYHVSRNLLSLRQQLSFIEDEDIHTMHDSVYTKYIMFKKFQAAMHVVAVSELAIFINLDSSLNNYWLRLLVREWAQFFIFLYIGCTFRSQMAPRFSVMPTLKSEAEKMVPPIFRIEVDAATYRDFTSHKWHIGLPTTPHKGSSKDSILVVIQHPNAYRPANFNAKSPIPAAATSMPDVNSNLSAEFHGRSKFGN